MARTPVVTKEEVATCAYDIINQEGIDALTIRRIAQKLNTSTAPIYTQYENMEAIMVQVITLAKEKLKNETITERTMDSFLNIGVGILAFVLENRMVFSHFFLTKDKPLLDLYESRGFYLGLMKQNPFLIILEDERLESLLENMWIYTYGMATMICTGVETSKDIRYYQKKLERMGSQLINYHLYSSGKYEAYVEKIVRVGCKYIDFKEVMRNEGFNN